jgi:type IV pilus assembly protein PilE
VDPETLGLEKAKGMNRQNASHSAAAESSGFSLLELMITVGILSILAAIAIPSYQHYVLKSHRTDAKTALFNLASMEERFFSTSSTYSTLPTDLGYSAASFPFNTLNADYTISQSGFVPAVPPSALAPAGTPATYAFTATAIGVQANDTNCLTFTLDSHGAQTATPDPNNDCWN